MISRSRFIRRDYTAVKKIRNSYFFTFRSDEEFQTLMVEKNKWYLELVQGLGPQDALPGALDFLQTAYDQGLKIALGSASKNAPMILEKLGITPLFTAIIDGNNVVNGKPHPEVFLKGEEEVLPWIEEHYKS